MDRERIKGLFAGLILLASSGLVSQSVRAGAVTGKLTVGIVILDTCHLAAPRDEAAQRLSAATGFSLHCSMGTHYLVDVTSPPAGTTGMDSSGRTTVTVRF